MTTDLRHVLGISGGKDSAALAIYLKTHCPGLVVDYYFADTGKELDETYQFIDDLEVFLDQKVTRLEAAKDSPVDPFDHYLRLYNGYLPSPSARWCTRKLKLEPFEEFFVGDAPALSYVAIRADEDREGYVSHKANIQTLFPFRRNIWSKEALLVAFSDANREQMVDSYGDLVGSLLRDTAVELVTRPESSRFSHVRRMNSLLDLGAAPFNRAVFTVLKSTKLPIGHLEDHPLLDNEETVDRDGVFRLLEESGVGKPKYYEPLEFEVDGAKGFYNRSRSGCYFCFYQQKIEWVWLYERHPERFKQAMEYEKDGFTWMDDERLEDLVQPNRLDEIKRNHLRTSKAVADGKSNYLVDVLSQSEGEGCTVCFI